MALDSIGQAFLVAAGDHREGVGGGGREATVIDVPGQLRGEPAAEGQAAVHPAPAAAEEFGDLDGRQVVGVGQ
ncbi:MAG: hypothetical protein HY928_14470 [Elusimicrobia bacterium]|nr:hypothetical protein [Elusimicrobiota bacterium]